MDARLSIRQDAMTSAQTMLARIFLAALLLITLITVGGCSMTQSRDEMFPPGVIVSPYDTTQGDVLWAVIPPINESGTSLANELSLATRSLAAAKASEVSAVYRSTDRWKPSEPSGFLAASNPQSDAHKVAEYLGADAVLAGSITAYDPYDPPVLGLALAIYARPGAMANASQSKLDTRALTMAFSDFGTFDGLSSRATSLRCFRTPRCKRPQRT